MTAWIKRSPEFKRLWKFSVGFYGVWLAHIGLRFGIFEELRRHPCSAVELGDRLRLDQPSVNSWLSAAVAFGYLKRSGDNFLLRSKLGEILLDKSSHEFLGGQFSYLTLRSLEYGKMDELFHTGKASSATGSFEAIDAATEWDHEAFLRLIKRNRQIGMLLERGCKFLDVGCGSGGLLQKLVRMYPKTQFTGIDPSEKAIELARKRLGGTASLYPLSGCDMAFSEEFDLIYCGEVLYSVSEKDKFLSRCREALSPGGSIVIVEGLIPARPRNPAGPEDLLIFGMQLDFALQGARFLRTDEISGLLSRAAFGSIRLTNLGGRLYLITARK